MDSSSKVSTYRSELKSELSRTDKDEKREKNKKNDFLIWRGSILHLDSYLPKETSITAPIISIGLSDKGALHLPHTAKPPKIGKLSSVDQETVHKIKFRTK